jgi:23S rRNA (uridine2552-2'-O)-methyltransferase
MPRRFLSERRRDPYYRAAQAEGLRSRAAFKLAHLAERFPIFRAGDRVLDLGAAPGGWSLVAREIVGPRGSITAVDPRAIDPIAGTEVVRARVGDPTLLLRLSGREFDVILSDMSPRVSGAYATDHARSVDLVRSAFGLGRRLFARGGSLVAKVFDGDLLPELEGELRGHFKTFRRTKPPASREPSSELYLIGLEFSALREEPMRAGTRNGAKSQSSGAGEPR